MCTLSYIFEYFSAEVSRRGWTASRCGMPEIICLFRSDLDEKRLDGPDAAPSGVPTVQSAWSEGGNEHTYKYINTNVIYLKTFANMVNLSGKDSRILQLRFNRENHVAEKSQRRPEEVVLSICRSAECPSSVAVFLRNPHVTLLHPQIL